MPIPHYTPRTPTYRIHGAHRIDYSTREFLLSIELDADFARQALKLKPTKIEIRKFEREVYKHFVDLRPGINRKTFPHSRHPIYRFEAGLITNINCPSLLNDKGLDASQRELSQVKEGSPYPLMYRPHNIDDSEQALFLVDAFCEWEHWAQRKIGFSKDL